MIILPDRVRIVKRRTGGIIDPRILESVPLYDFTLAVNIAVRVGGDNLDA